MEFETGDRQMTCANGSN